MEEAEIAITMIETFTENMGDKLIPYVEKITEVK